MATSELMLAMACPDTIAAATNIPAIGMAAIALALVLLLLLLLSLCLSGFIMSTLNHIQLNYFLTF
jgi:hypothetical protein